MNTWQQLRSSVRRTARLVLGLSLVTNLAMLVLPLYSLQIFDRVLTSASLETLWMLLAGVVIIGITGIGFEHLRRNVLTEFGFYLEAQIFPVFIERLNVPGFKANKRELLEEYNFSQRQIQGAYALVFVDALLMPLFVAITWLIHPLLGLFTLGVNALLIVMIMIKYKWQLPEQAAVQQARSSQQAMMLSNSSALAWLTMTANRDRWFTNRQQDWSQQVCSARQNELPNSIITNVNQCLRWLAQAGLPTLGAMLLLSNEITTGGFIAGLIIGGKTVMPVEAMIANLDSLRKMKLFFNKLKTLLEPVAVDESGYQAEVTGQVLMTGLQLGDSNSAVNPSHLFNLSANPGEMVALVGPSGSGQDRIIRQLMRYEPVANGVITIDGIRLEDWDKQTFSQSVGFMSGAIQLPEIPIRSIITAFGRISTTAAIAAAERSGLNRKLIEWDLGYEAVFQPGLMEPAANQSLRQLISLTAALAADPQILILENPETHLDMDAMALLEQILIEEKQRGKTLILTTQSKRLLKLAGCMILLNKGRTVFNGRPDAFEPAGQVELNQSSVVTMPAHPAANQPLNNKQTGVQQ